MHKMTKPFICPECNQSFTGKDARGFQTARFPVVLNCAHSVCMICAKLSAKQQKRIFCPKCKKVTDLANGESSAESLPPDVYIVGTLSNLNRTIPRNFKIKFLPAGTTCIKEPASPSNLAKCENCNGNAKWRCDNCAVNLCIKCFDKIHKENKIFKKHHVTRIAEQSYRLMVRTGCREHDQKAIEYFCEDDRQLACSHCAVTGSHSGHRLVTLLKKNESCIEEISKVEEEAKRMKARLKLTEEKLTSMIPDCKPNTLKYEQEIRDYFHELHCCLQLREAALLNDLSEVTFKSLSPLENLRQQVLDNIKELSSLLEDASTVKNNCYIAVNAVELIAKLRQSLDLPCHLVPIETPPLPAFPSLTLVLEENLKESLLNVGQIETHVEERYRLSAEKDLPPDYRIEPVDNGSETTTTDGDTSSFNGDALSPGIVTANRVPKVLVRPKAAKSFSQEVVCVSHIKNPGEFWVQRENDLGKLKTLEKNINRFCNLETGDPVIPSQLEIGSLYLVQYGNDKNWYRARLKVIIGDTSPTPSEASETVANRLRNRLVESTATDGVVTEDSMEVTNHERTEVASDVPENESDVSDAIESTVTDKVNEVETMAENGVCIDPAAGDVSNGNLSLQKMKNVLLANEVEVNEELKKLKEGSTFQVTVQYVDYGNTETLSISRIRMIRTEFLKLPCLALHCSLWEIEPNPPGEWSLESVKLFAKLVGNYEALMRVVDERNNVLYVDLCKPPVADIRNDVPVSVREALVFLEAAHFPNPQAGLMPIVRRQQRLTFFPPEPLLNGQKLNIIVSHINTPSDFYIQQLGIGARYLSDVIFEVQDYYGNESNVRSLAVFVPTIGMACMAQFSVDKQWYRAQVIGLPGAGMVEVFYVDFGNIEVVLCWQLAKAIDKFLKLPAQAVHCSLADIVPIRKPNWSEEAIAWFKDATKKELISMIVHEYVPKEKAVVSLFEVTEFSVRCIGGLLAVEGYGRSTGTRSSFTEEKRHVVPVEEKQERPFLNDVSSSSVKVRKKHNYTPVIICHYEDPGCIFILDANKDKKPLERLMDQLKEAYNESEPEPREWIEGELCVVLDPKEQKCYRGKITSRDENLVSVFLLDYGRTEKASVTHLRVLRVEFQRDAMFAVKCHLTGVKPAGDSKKWSRSACECLREILFAQPILHAKIKSICENDSQAIDLFVKDVRKGSAVDPDTIVYSSVTRMLIDEGLAIPTQRSSRNSKAVSEEETSTDNRLDRTPMIPPTEIPDEFPLTPADPSLSWITPDPIEEREMDVLPTYVGYDGIIYFHLYSDDIRLRNMSDAFVRVFGSSNDEEKRSSGLIREGQICVAKFFLDQKWYRAEVTKILANDALEVYFVDYGNVQKVTFEDVRTYVTFLDVPKLCHRAVLYNATPISPSSQWPVATLTLIHETIVDKICRMRIEKRDGRGLDMQICMQLPGDVSLLDFLEEKGLIEVPEEPALPISLNELTSGRAKNIPYHKLPSVPVGSSVPVVVTCLFDPNIVCIQMLKVAKPTTLVERQLGDEHDHFLAMMADLAESAAAFHPLENPKPGMACCGLYTFDENWYRCLVLEVLEDDMISVYYVDYGNSEVLPLERLRQLPRYYLRFPMQGLICRLHGVKPNGDDWSEEAAHAMLRLFFDKTMPSAKFVAEIMSQGASIEVRVHKMDPENYELKLAYQSLIDDGTITVS